MELHPVTILLGIIVTIIMLFIVGVGFSCTIYEKFPEQHPEMKLYHELGKKVKLC